jgi:glycosyltransferase involved in cell wall biosynthesis
MAGGGEAEDNPVNLNVVAMVDIIFCLCIFFMCSFKFKQLEGKFQSWLPKDKGSGAASDPGEIKEIRIAMLWDADQKKPRRMFGHKVVGDGEEGIRELETLIQGAYEDWQRKGGPFLLRLADELLARGMPTVVRCIGPEPSNLPAHPALQPLGFLSKHNDMARFVGELRSWHFGTLFSEAEAFGISNRECLRLGVPVLTHAVGGIASTVPDEGCGQLFPAHPTAEEVADWIAGRLDPYEGYLCWRATLAPRWRQFTWAAAVEQLAEILHSASSEA